MEPPCRQSGSLNPTPRNDVNQGVKTRTFSVPKNPDFELVILNSIQSLFDNWQCQHQKDSASGNLGFPCAE